MSDITPFAGEPNKYAAGDEEKSFAGEPNKEFNAGEPKKCYAGEMPPEDPNLESECAGCA